MPTPQGVGSRRRIASSEGAKETDSGPQGCEVANQAIFVNQVLGGKQQSKPAAPKLSLLRINSTKTLSPRRQSPPTVENHADPDSAKLARRWPFDSSSTRAPEICRFQNEAIRVLAAEHARPLMMFSRPGRRGSQRMRPRRSSVPLLHIYRQAEWTCPGSPQVCDSEDGFGRKLVCCRGFRLATGVPRKNVVGKKPYKALC